MQGIHPKNDTKEDVTKIVFFVMVVATILLLFFVYDYLEGWRSTNQPPEELLTSGVLACIEMGCSPGTNFIGSVNGDVYHDCDSSYARSILAENRVCFPSAVEAVAQGYRASKV